MKRIVVLIIFLLVIPHAIAAAEVKKIWNSIELATVENLEFHLMYLPIASLGDEEWIRLVFKNKGDKPVQIKDVSYRIESERFSIDGKTRIAIAGLASGGTHSLFPHAWETTPIAAIVISPGETYVVAGYPSRYSSALLNMPPKEGLLVKAKLYFDLDLKGTKRFSSPKEGAYFEFKWQYPNKDDFIHMQQRLKVLLREAKSESTHAYILKTLLGISEVSKDISFDELTEAINRRSGRMGGRNYLVDHLYRKFDKEKVIDFYLARLKNKDTRIFDDLMEQKSIWSTAFIEPLIVMHENIEDSAFRALFVLNMHVDEWKKDRAITSRLSSAVLKNYGMLLKQTPQKLIEKNELQAWSMYVYDLANTYDINVLPLIAPFLDYKNKVVERPLLWPSGTLPPPYRACDAALHAILNILDGDIKKAYLEMGIVIPTPYEDWPSTTAPMPSDEQITVLRDAMITKLKARLAKL